MSEGLFSVNSIWVDLYFTFNTFLRLKLITDQLQEVLTVQLDIHKGSEVINKPKVINYELKGM